MPGQDGWSVLAALKEDPALAQVPVIMLTMVDDRSLGFALGASDYLMKPVERPRLMAVLHKYQATLGADVLVVEDDGPTREMLRKQLVKEGCRVREAENGRVALEMVRKAQPQLIFLDLMMPEMDGFQLVAEMQKDTALAHIPVVVVTAKDITTEDRERLAGHVEQVLQKGAYSRETLLAKVREFAARVRQHKPEGTGHGQDTAG